MYSQYISSLLIFDFLASNRRFFKIKLLVQHLHICSLGQFVIFYGITGFQRRGFLQIISINHRLT